MVSVIRASLCGLAIIFLASCNSTGGSFCDIAKPIRLSDQVIDAMTDAEVAAALAMNEKGAALCGWTQ